MILFSKMSGYSYFSKSILALNAVASCKRITQPVYKGCKFSSFHARFVLPNTIGSTLVNFPQNTATLVGTHGHPFHSSSYLYFTEDRDSKALMLLKNVKQVRHSPVAALVLGFAGLVPFVAAPMYIISTGMFLPSVAYAQLAYGASILSFIGGVRWGLTLPEGSTQSPDWHNLGYSVTPSLIAWAALLASPTLGSLAVMGGLGLAGYMDIAMWGYPNWFKGMRFCLTFVALLSLWTTFMCRFILSTEQNESGDTTDGPKKNI